MSLTSLQRGLEMLTKVTQLGPMRVDEIAVALDMPKSTAYRYVKMFKDANFLYEIDGVYSAGLMISSRDEQSEKQHIVEMAAPAMKELRELTDETVILTVRVQAAALCLERLPAGRTNMLSFYRGSVRPLYAGASATALLAYAPADVIESVRKGTMRRFTGLTPSPERLGQILPAIRSNGYAVSEGEVDPFMVGVAAPVFRHGHCICVLSVAGKQSSLQGQKLDDVVQQVRGAADKLGPALESDAGSGAWMTEEGW
ncbi:IclR family transcriptional regulator [Pseudarthrobacter sp. AL07]|uniref:IclR family transcriptional regulator n=1 Tax=unclassified Pseudarthrobacter TaxID=2647000 RepID=UPI00249B3892|nr:MULTISPECIES: IclR family transcriptional regulator [unclassified Pseudarthrobacter]MDI3194599.1 IclR family transcriptional regulator [Pseudarthrobacter sp. AL20]MDI3208666.1 IclR family transcriptional regulator [Pseudarthrobacter sp. AL07]